MVTLCPLWKGERVLSRDRQHEKRQDLSAASKRALVILLEDGLIIRETNFWNGKSRRNIYISTIEALYDRYLIKIVIEGRHRRRHTAMLTDIGEYAAKEIQRELAPVPPNAPHGIPEDAVWFISEVVG